MISNRYAAYKADDGVWCVWDHVHNQTVLESDGWLETAVLPDCALAVGDPETWARQAAEIWNKRAAATRAGRREIKMTTVFDHVEQFRIPCPHESKGENSCRGTIPDHHPLTADDIEGLVSFALVSRSVIDYSQAVIRLYQGIPGMECPRPAEGEVAELMTWVERFMADMAQGTGYTPVSVLVRVLAPKGASQAGEGAS